MTRKDYVALAEAFRSVRREPFHAGTELAWADCVRAVAGALATDNPRFDRERFVKACQGEGHE